MEKQYFDKEGAEALAKEIREFWKKRGYKVKVRVVKAPFDNAVRCARYDVRSDLVNGRPKALKRTTTVNNQPR